MAVLVLRIAIMGIVFLGAVAPGATVVFNFSDPMMGILAIVNLHRVPCCCTPFSGSQPLRQFLYQRGGCSGRGPRAT